VFSFTSSGEQPAKIRQPVQVWDDPRVPTEADPNGVPLGPANDSPGKIQRGTHAALTWHDELGRHCSAGLGLPDAPPERFHHLFGDERFARDELAAIVGCRRNLRHDDPEASLQGRELPVKGLTAHLGPCKAQYRLGFVDGADGLDAPGVLPDPPAVKKAGRAVVSSPSRDAH
jgi:hypothetical protein